jgi:lysophospholipase L1-like esterase
VRRGWLWRPFADEHGLGLVSLKYRLLRRWSSFTVALGVFADAPFIDAYEAGWFTGANSPGFDFDGAHPNTAGHADLAEKFLESWATLISLS